MKFLLLFILFFVFSCADNTYDRSDYRKTVKVSKGYYVEVFRIASSGAFGSDLSAVYLTDSIHFRFFVGKADQQLNRYVYKFEKDTVIVLNTDNTGFEKQGRIIDERKYSLKDLKLLKNYP